MVFTIGLLARALQLEMLSRGPKGSNHCRTAKTEIQTISYGIVLNNNNAIKFNLQIFKIDAHLHSLERKLGFRNRFPSLKTI